MTMSSNSSHVLAVQKNDIHGLHVLPEIAGAEHEFVYEGRHVHISVPTVQDDWYERRSDEFASMSIETWREDGGARIPIICSIKKISVGISIDLDRNLYDLILQRNGDIPNNVRRKIDKILLEADSIRSEAYARWIDIMRWKTFNDRIGRPAHKQGSRHATIIDRLSKNILYNGSYRFTAILLREKDGVTHSEWSAVQSTLQNGDPVPLWFIFYFQGKHRQRVGDFADATINFAIACEAMVRFVFQQDFLRYSELSTGAQELIDEINIRSIINKSKKLKFWPISLNNAMRDIHALFDARNKIVHGQRSHVSREDVDKFSKASEIFIRHFDQD